MASTEPVLNLPRHLKKTPVLITTVLIEHIFSVSCIHGANNKVATLDRGLGGIHVEFGVVVRENIYHVNFQDVEQTLTSLY